MVVGILALGMGCGGSSGSSSGRSGANGGQCPATTSNGQTCAGEKAFETCLTTACGTQAKACFGNNYASGSFTGSLCADYMGCIMKCPCDATKTACENNCSTQFLATAAGATCMTCLTTLGYCVVQAKCPDPCTGSTSTGTSTLTTTTTTTNTSTTTGPNCTAAQACCTSLAAAAGGAALQQSCQTAVASAGTTESLCLQIVQGFQTAGYCK